MDLHTAIRLRALRAVLRPDDAYHLRVVMRWYSKTFFTPLREVEELPLEEIWQAYYEEQYANMSDVELDHVKAELLTTDEQRYEQIVAEEAEEAEMFEMRRILEAEERAKAVAAQKEQQKNEIANVAQKPGPILPVKLPETDLPSALPNKLPPAITMTFVDEADFERELDGFGTMSQPEKPKP